MRAIKLSSKNQLVLPKEARDAMHVKGGDELLVVIKGNTTVILPKPGKYAEPLYGKGKGVYKKNYLKKERQSW
ncbi:MAG: AbrB/MazE/SpoVT family DNA-binding domain-containing protein [Nitrospinae bacterium]|nr:AbrB/MazE/SpoVT family DNA-binding domain-containing protein [Nitrospinota bacterium]